MFHFFSHDYFLNIVDQASPGGLRAEDLRQSPEGLTEEAKRRLFESWVEAVLKDPIFAMGSMGLSSNAKRDATVYFLKNYQKNPDNHFFSNRKRKKQLECLKTLYGIHRTERVNDTLPLTRVVREKMWRIIQAESLAAELMPVSMWPWSTSDDVICRDIIDKAIDKKERVEHPGEYNNYPVGGVALEILLKRFEPSENFNEVAANFRGRAFIPRHTVEVLCKYIESDEKPISDPYNPYHANARLLLLLLKEKAVKGEIGQGMVSRFFFNLLYKNTYIFKIDAALAKHGRVPANQEALSAEIDQMLPGGEERTHTVEANVNEENVQQESVNAEVFEQQLQIALSAQIFAATVIVSNEVVTATSVPATACNILASLLSFVPAAGGALTAIATAAIQEVDTRDKKAKSQKLINAVGIDNVGQKIKYFCGNMAKICENYVTAIAAVDVVPLADAITECLCAELIRGEVYVSPEDWFELATKDISNLPHGLKKSELAAVAPFVTDAQLNETYYQALRTEHTHAIAAVHRGLNTAFVHLNALNTRLCQVEQQVMHVNIKVDGVHEGLRLVGAEQQVTTRRVDSVEQLLYNERLQKRKDQLVALVNAYDNVLVSHFSATAPQYSDLAGWLAVQCNNDRNTIQNCSYDVIDDVAFEEFHKNSCVALASWKDCGEAFTQYIQSLQDFPSACSQQTVTVPEGDISDIKIKGVAKRLRQAAKSNLATKADYQKEVARFQMDCETAVKDIKSVENNLSEQFNAKVVKSLKNFLQDVSTELENLKNSQTPAQGLSDKATQLKEISRVFNSKTVHTALKACHTAYERVKKDVQSEEFSIFVQDKCSTEVDVVAHLQALCDFFELVALRKELEKSFKTLKSIEQEGWKVDSILNALTVEIKKLQGVQVSEANSAEISRIKQYIQTKQISSESTCVLHENIKILNNNRRMFMQSKTESVPSGDLEGSFLFMGTSLPIHEVVQVDQGRCYHSLSDLHQELVRQNEELGGPRLSNGHGTTVNLNRLNSWPVHVGVTSVGLFSCNREAANAGSLSQSSDLEKQQPEVGVNAR